MLKEYTLKVTVQVGGETKDQCEEFAQRTINDMASRYECSPEITHEEVVEVERE